ncbi:hypothetical protein Q1695_011991 [Nippostrongylus brasiliensis]|nr:hypothetical protein Q1695_011991 [Nippostrongylus brasiliensis]
MLSRLPQARHIYIRDIHQLESFARCSTSTSADLLGTESMIDVLTRERKRRLILLTTRTHFTPETGEFVDDVPRVNIALTRCPPGRFVLGHQLSPTAVPVWDEVLTWAHNHGGLVQDVDMEEYLPAR